MTYGIYFHNRVPAERLREALHDVYGVAPELIYVGPHDRLDDHPGPDPIALITPPDEESGDFGQELSGGDRLHEATGASELDLARALCRAAGTSALVDDGGDAPDY